MGCPSSKVSQKLLKSIVMVPFQYEGIGLLTAKIQPVVEVNRSEHFFSKNLNFLQLTICDQQFIVPLICDPVLKQSLKPLQNQFDFIINKVNVQKCLQVKILSQSSLKRLSKTASARQVLKQEFFLSKDRTYTQKQSYNMELTSQNDVKVGWVRVQLVFQPREYEILTMRVNAVTLTNSTRKNRKVYVNIKIGGQQYQTQSLKSNEKTIPTWSNAMHSFIVPKFLKSGKLFVYEKDQEQDVDYLIGELIFDLELILKDDSIQSFSEQITSKNKVTGTIFLMFLKTKNQIPQNPNLQLPKRIKIEQEIPSDVFDFSKYQMDGRTNKKVSCNTYTTSNTQKVEMITSRRLTKKLTQYTNNKIESIQQSTKQHMYQSSNYHESYQREKIFQQKIECSNSVQKQNHYSPTFINGERQQNDSQLDYKSEIIHQTDSIILRQLPLISNGNKLKSSTFSRSSSSSKKKQSSLKIDINSNLPNELCKMKTNLAKQYQINLFKKTSAFAIHHHENISRQQFSNNEKQNINQRQLFTGYNQQMNLTNNSAIGAIEQYFIEQGFPQGSNFNRQISQTDCYHDEFQIRVNSSISSKTCS